LEQVESRFVRALTGTDALAQITPGLFAALTVRPGGVNAADKLFCRLLRSIADPVELDGAPLTLNLSGGAAFSTGDAEQIPKLLTQALDAHRWSAAARPNELLYFRDQRPGVESRPALQDDLKSAVARDQLSLYCMPEVSLVDGALAGLQALTRWVHPRYGMIDRSILTALRGDSELARTVLLWVLRELLATAATAQAAAPTLKRITLDAHATELADEHFADLVALACGEAGQSASILTLSIAATELDSLHEDALAQLIKVRDLGAHIAIAKFGVQSPSKKSLARIPFDTIVIDPLCLRASVTNGKARRALHSALARMENQSVRRIAYGIESLHELQAALTFGCQYLQGLICGRPIAAVQVGAFVRSIKPDGLSFLASNRQSLEGVA
jgi:EAL domain-containing protein (putative c-di-GMP-specific phosphodiesterase class I)